MRTIHNSVHAAVAGARPQAATPSKVLDQPCSCSMYSPPLANEKKSRSAPAPTARKTKGSQQNPEISGRPWLAHLTANGHFCHTRRRRGTDERAPSSISETRNDEDNGLHSAPEIPLFLAVAFGIASFVCFVTSHSLTPGFVIRIRRGWPVDGSSLLVK